MNGLFVTVEGIDGAGKSTVVNTIQTEYKQSIVSKEPSELWTGDAVYRSITSDNTNPFTDFYLFMADRAHHIDNIIKPGLKDDMLVISDRFADSTRAYQFNALNNELPHGEEYTEQYIDDLMKHWNIQPDLTIYLDISVDTSIERCDGEDKYEDREFLEQVSQRYDYLQDKYNDRYVVVNGERNKDQVKQDVIDIIREHESFEPLSE